MAQGPMAWWKHSGYTLVMTDVSPERHTVRLAWSWGQNPGRRIPSQARSTTASLRMVIDRETGSRRSKNLSECPELISHA